MATAGERVFDTAELLEAVLAEVPPRQLLLTQRVCKTWQMAIKGSKRLQRLLFFEPVSDLVLVPYDDPDPEVGCFWCSAQDVSEVYMGSPVRNPLLWSWLLALQMKPLKSWDIIRQRWNEPEASWKKMLLSQPATGITLQITGPHKGEYPAMGRRAGDILGSLIRAKGWQQNGVGGGRVYINEDGVMDKWHSNAQVGRLVGVGCWPHDAQEQVLDDSDIDDRV